MTKVTQFKITTLGNLHVGSGEQNFGVVDNLVQRDPITEIPMINSSSLKGAIRDHFETEKLSIKKIRTIFGHADKDSANAGEVKFLQAELLALPVRSNRQLYFLATTAAMLREYVNNHKILTKKSMDIDVKGISKLKEDVCISTSDTDCWVEDYEVKKNNVTELQEISEKLFDGHPLALMSDEVFKTITVPIITRNKIAKHEDDDNNLFYEEVIPRRTIFYSYMITPDGSDIEDEELKDVFDEFISSISKKNIQVGANASIGYGLCEFKEVEDE